jgi:hypothetical protein
MTKKSNQEQLQKLLEKRSEELALLTHHVHEEISRRQKAEAELFALQRRLNDLTERVEAATNGDKPGTKKLSGLLHICASCKRIRDHRGAWSPIDSYIQRHSEAVFSHGLCLECSDKLYPEINEDV